MSKESLMVLIFVLCALAMGGEVSAQEHTYVVFEDDFEDGNLDRYQRWTTMSESYWNIISENGNNVLKGYDEGELKAGEKTWTDYTFTGKFKPIKGKFSFFVRESGAGRYKIHININGGETMLIVEEYDVSSAVIAKNSYGLPFLSFNEWHDFKVEVKGNKLKVYLDGYKMLDAEDEENTYSKGRFGLFVSQYSEVLFDDLKVLTEPPPMGSVSVTSNPSGANVAIRHVSQSKSKYVESGMTPVTINDLMEGGYWIKVTKDGYLNDTKPVTVSANEVSSVDVTLEPDEEIATVAEVAPVDKYTYVVFEDDFEDEDFEGWDLDWGGTKEGDLEIVSENGNNVLKKLTDSVLATETRDFEDYSYTGKFKIIKGFPSLWVRITDFGVYMIDVSNNEVKLEAYEHNGDTIELSRKTVTVDKNKWHDFKVSVEGSNIRFYLNDELIIDANDEKNLYPGGRIGLKVIQYSEVLFDDIKVLTEPPPEAISSAHTYLVFEDDFEDGDFDGWDITWREFPDDDWYVVQENGNNIVKGDGNTKIDVISRGWRDYTFTGKLKLLKGEGDVWVRESSLGGYQIDISDSFIRIWSHVHNGEMVELTKKDLAVDKEKWQDFKVVLEGSNIKFYLNDELVIDADDESDMFTRGSVSLSSVENSEVYFDDIKVFTEPPPESAVASTVDNLFNPTGTQPFNSGLYAGIIGLISISLLTGLLFLDKRSKAKIKQELKKKRPLKFYPAILGHLAVGGFMAIAFYGLTFQELSEKFESTKLLFTIPLPYILLSSLVLSYGLITLKPFKNVNRFHILLSLGFSFGIINFVISNEHPSLMDSPLPLAIPLFATAGISLWHDRKNIQRRGKPQKEAQITPLTSSRSLPSALKADYSDPEYLGEGGFAMVFGVTRKDGQKVAIKIPKNIDAKTGKMFIREVSNWSNLDHENIVKLFDYNIYPLPHLEMELCDGQFDFNVPAIEKTVSMVCDIAKGLRHAHKRKIIHGDLKSSNLLLNEGGIKISDWGLSKMKITGSVKVSGITPENAAPEQFSPKFGKADERTDVYQLGTIFYELATGKPVFEGDISEIYESVIKRRPESPSSINSNATPLDDIIMRCLEKKKDDRYQTMEELIFELEAMMPEHPAADAPGVGDTVEFNPDEKSS
jgi:hypothetical protein